MYHPHMAKKPEASFAGSIPDNYDRYIGPMLMVPYARDLAARLPINGLSDVLELACGTGIVTKVLRDRLGEGTRLTATDISEGMLKVAKTKEIEKKVEWKVVDATELPFKDNSFDVVVSQFGVMFFPDKAKALKEIFRVLRPGGRILFNTWDKIQFNDFARIAHEVIGKMFESDPPAFYKIPFGFYDHFEIRTLLRNAGFYDIGLSTVEMKVQSEASAAAKGMVEGNPISDEIKSRLGMDIKEATERVERAIASDLGQRMSKGQARAIIVGARKAESSSNGKVAVNAEPAKAEKAKAKPSAAKPKPKPKTKTTAKAK